MIFDVLRERLTMGNALMQSQLQIKSAIYILNTIHGKQSPEFLWVREMTHHRRCSGRKLPSLLPMHEWTSRRSARLLSTETGRRYTTVNDTGVSGVIRCWWAKPDNDGIHSGTEEERGPVTTGDDDIYAVSQPRIKTTVCVRERLITFQRRRYKCTILNGRLWRATAAVRSKGPNAVRVCVQRACAPPPANISYYCSVLPG